MAQVSQQNNLLDPASLPVKRKRGRPRKDETHGSGPSLRTQQRRRNAIPSSGSALVGQTVTGILDGVFDAGFLITVRVGSNGPVFKGMVFDSRVSVPITPENDIAPGIKMWTRNEIPIPVPESQKAPEVVPLQRREPSAPPPFTPKAAPNDGGHQAALPLQMREPAPQPFTENLLLNERSQPAPPPLQRREPVGFRPFMNHGKQQSPSAVLGLLAQAASTVQVSAHQEGGPAGVIRAEPIRAEPIRQIAPPRPHVPPTGLRLEPESSSSNGPPLPPTGLRLEAEESSTGADRIKSPTTAAEAETSTPHVNPETLVAKANPIGNNSNQAEPSGAA